MFQFESRLNCYLKKARMKNYCPVMFYLLFEKIYKHPASFKCPTSIKRPCKYVPMYSISKKKKKTVSKKKTFLKWNCSDDFTADFDTDEDITFLKCKICRKYTAQIRTEARSCNLRSQILDSILSYVDGGTYVHEANVCNHVKAGGLHDWTKKKFVMDS